MKHRAPQPYKKLLKAESKKNRTKGERIAKQGIRNLIDSIFPN